MSDWPALLVCPECHCRSHAQLILHDLSQHLGYSPPPLLERIAEDAQKILQKRPLLQERLATATQQEEAC
jgi:putative transposase